jgi:phage terminase large subunit-like protein
MRHEMTLMKNATEEQQRRAFKNATPERLLAFDADFETWAHENQLPPNGEGWRVWLMMAGRGFGKTRAGAEWIYRLASGKAGVRVALVGATIGDARSIMVEGVSGLLSIARRSRRRLNWEPSLSRLQWPNGSQAQLFSGDNADGLRGPEFDFAWADELAKWRQAEAAWDNLQMALRRGPRPRVLATTTPRPMRLLEHIRDAEWAVTTTGRTSDNINLDEKFIDVITATYGGTRIGAQELDGVLLQDVEGALWTREVIERSRALPLHHASHGPAPRAGEEYDRIVVGVDPPAGVGEGSDACGIVVAGSKGEKLFVLEDATVRGLSPEGWASRVAAAAARWNTSVVIAEANNGGRWSRACSRPRT